ncbi:MAG: response regulator, partial [Candidatus Omnitrophica bacterium]|nr:response regulator [Candidatus Omnitrophota bacterium]
IIDDEIDVREFVASFFRKRKIDVITASNGKEAIDLVKKQRPNLILLDIKMPDMDGIEALRQIREKDKDVTVIMVTGKSPEDENAFNKCRQFGASDYIHKPLELDILEKTVMGIFGKTEG